MKGEDRVFVRLSTTPEFHYCSELLGLGVKIFILQFCFSARFLELTPFSKVSVSI